MNSCSTRKADPNGLTMTAILNMPFLQLAKIVNAESYAMSERNKAAHGLHMRAGAEMNGAGWLALGIDEKATVRKAMKFQTEV